MPRRAEVMSRVLGVDMEDISLHEFADSAVGRSISESIIKNGIDQELSDMARVMFERFKAEQETEIGASASYEEPDTDADD